MAKRRMNFIQNRSNFETYMKAPGMGGMGWLVGSSTSRDQGAPPGAELRAVDCSRGPKTWKASPRLCACAGCASVRELDRIPSFMAIPHNLRKGAIIRLEGKAYLVLEYRESRTGQRRPTLHVKIRDVLQGKVLEKSIDDGVPVDVVDSQTRVLQYLYSDPATCHFMDVRTYDQLDIPHEVVGDGAVFLLEETEYKVLFLEDQPVLVELPPTVVLDVVDTPP